MVELSQRIPNFDSEDDALAETGNWKRARGRPMALLGPVQHGAERLPQHHPQGHEVGPSADPLSGAGRFI